MSELDTIVELLHAQESRMSDRMDRQDKRLDEILEQAKRTNGRVSKLEMWRRGLDAVKEAHAWMRPALIAFLSGGGVATLTWTLGHALG